MATYVTLPNGQTKAIIRRKELRGRALTKTGSKAAVKAWATAQEAALNDGAISVYAQQREAKVGGVLLMFRDEQVPKRKGSRQDTARINRLLHEPFANMDFTQDVTGALIDWRNKALKPKPQGLGLAPGSVRRYMTLLGSAFRWAIQEKRLKITNPMRDVIKPSDGGRRERTWIAEDFTAFLDVAGFDFDCKPELQGDKVPWIMLLARTTGWRLSEICKIQNQLPKHASARTFASERGYIDLSVPEVYFPPTEERDGVKVGGTKNDAGFHAPLREDAVKVIKKLLEFFPTPANYDPTVAPPTLLGIGEDSAGEFYRRLRKKVAVKHPHLANIVLHELRHTWTTEMCKAIEDPMIMLRMSGRKSLSSLNHYYHPDASHLAKQMKKAPTMSIPGR